MKKPQRQLLLCTVLLCSLLSAAFTHAPILADDGSTPTVPGSAPDLIVQSITWSPQFPLLNNAVTFTATVKNRGSSQAGPSNIAWYVDDVFRTSNTISAIEPGAMATTTLVWKAKGGSHTVRAIADHSGVIPESDETNNDSICAFSVLAPDLVIQDIAWSPLSPSIGDKVIFTVSVKNQGGVAAGSSNVEFSIGGNSRGYKEVLGLDAGATLNRTFDWVSQEGAHTLRAVADVLNQVEEGEEANNEKTLAFSTAAPDLVVSSITWSPSSPLEGNSVNMTITVKNQGAGRAEPSYIVYYVDDNLQGSIYVSRIDVGSSVSANAPWIVQVGKHTFKAVADFKNEVLESDETNNSTTVSLPGPAPDLVVQGITWSPSSVLTGQAVNFNVIIYNQGGGRSGYFRVHLFVDSTNKLQQDISGLDAGATITVTFPWVARAYSYALKAVADAENNISETDESNNSKMLTASFSPAALPDLVIQDVSWSPKNPLPGDKMVFTVSIKNQGLGQANASYVAGYIDDIPQTPVYVTEMNGLDTATASFGWTAPGGSHTLKLVADSSGVINESNEGNNEKTFTISIAAPDLVVQSVTLSPRNPSAGDAAAFIVTIKNRGNLIAGRSYVAYYVDDTYKGFHDVPAVGAGATVTDNLTWTAQAGQHYLKIVVDSTNIIGESNETNNQRTVSLPFGDLVIPSLTWSPPNPSAGDPVVFTVAIKNNGSGAAGSSNLDFLVDGKSTGHKVVPEIAAGSTFISVVNWTAQGSQHSFKALADVLNQIDESDESNNEASVALLVLVAAPAVPPPTTVKPSPQVKTSPPATTKASATPPNAGNQAPLSPKAVPGAAAKASPTAKASPAKEPTREVLPIWWVAAAAVVLAVSAIVIMRLRGQRPSVK